MGDLTLVKLNKDKVERLHATPYTLEKSLQTLIENNLEEIFSIRFLASEYSTGKKHGARIDTLGIDENNCPVIIEYKRSTGENVINQGLFYLAWLLDHKAEFKLLVIEKLGKDYAEKIEWATTRLLCIAYNFTKYDNHAVEQINRNIELIKYKKYKEDMLLFELVNVQTANIQTETIDIDNKKPSHKDKTFAERLKQANEELVDLYNHIDEFILNFGDDVQAKELKFYKAYKKIRNFICLEIRPKNKHFLLFLKLDPKKEDLKDGLMRDVGNVSHFGTGDLELKISNIEDFEQTKNLITKSYDMG